MTAFDQDPAWRRSWCRHAGDDFRPAAPHALCRTRPRRRTGCACLYAGDMFQVKIGLKANDSIEVHPPLLKPRDMKPLEFDLPPAATRDGTLNLSWTAEPNAAATAGAARWRRCG